MVQIDASGATTPLSILTADHVDHAAQLSVSPSAYSWTTTSGFTVTALSMAGDITASGTAPTGGTIDTVTIFSGSSPILTVTGLNVPLTGLVNATNSTLHQEKFWERILAGETTVILPLLPVSLGLAGDFFTVNGGQTRNGSNDTFTGTNNPATHQIVGDALLVEATAVLNGGNDRITGAAGYLVGDAGNFSGGGNAGTVNGGDDTITATDRGFSPIMALSNVIGDVDGNTGIVEGGADRIVLTNVAAASNVVGDVLSHNAGTVTGGDDTILLQRTGSLFTPSVAGLVSGDVLISMAGADVNGGDDTLTVKNFGSVTFVLGDAYTAEGNVTGGDDKISIVSTAAIFKGPPAVMPPLPTVGVVSGDAMTIGLSDTIGGGDDHIMIKNANVSMALGDLQSSGGTAVVGGDDTIAATWNQINIPPAAPFSLVGDAAIVASGLLDGGNDRLTVKYAGPSPALITIAGDAQAFGGSGNLIGGDDFISATSNQPTGTTLLFGDAQNVSTTGSFAGGNDTIIGTMGNDSIVGDAVSVTAGSDTGGKDVLNGRGGNDTIDGGKGSDTALYSSLKQAVYVDLTGIAGTAALPADYVEAIGQGNDQLISIENIVGSALNDTILGNSLANSFEGGNGDDLLAGRGGADTLLGGAGNDTIFGGGGKDLMTGGTGADTFLFKALADSGLTNSAADRITDFVHLTDKIDISAIDANGVLPGETAFSFVGTNALGIGKVGYFTQGGNTFIHGSINADPAAEFIIRLDGIVTLTAADFIL